MEKTLPLYKLVNGVASAFPSVEEQIVLSAFTVTRQRMGGAPSVSATVMYHDCLDGQWNDVFVSFGGERYFVRNEPGSEKSNSDRRYSHTVVFESERQALDEVYMIDAILSEEQSSEYKTNDTKIQFFGDIDQWASRLNDALTYCGLYNPLSEEGYHVVVDSGISTEDKLVSFEEKFISEALQEGFKVFQIPYYFVGKEIHFGYTENLITDTIEYGIENALIKIGRQNANIKLANRMSGYGSSDNIPYYYPNPTPLGSVSLNVSSDSITASIRSMESLALRVSNFPLTYGTSGLFYGNGIAESALNSAHTGVASTVNFADTFELDSQNYIKATVDVGSDWSLWSRTTAIHGGTHSTASVRPYAVQNWDIETYNPYFVSATNITAKNIQTGTTYNVGAGATLPAGTYTVSALITISLETPIQYDGDVNYTVSAHYLIEGGAWKNIAGGEVKLRDLGLNILGTPQIGDTISLNVTGRVTPIGRLMPPIYRETDGEERFYNALNNTYPLPEGTGYYHFENPYSANDRRELIQEFDDIKPTIVGITNASNQRIDKFIAFAWDTGDNDETDEQGNYIHPYFFAKLAKTNGTYAFNLFDCALDSAMQVVMTSGTCGSCKFEIGVDSESLKNPVQVDSSGNLLRDANGNVRCGRTGMPKEIPLDRQQDTSSYEVWLALKKDNKSYPVIMPSYVRNLKPTTNDTFVLMNINMPQAYILAAEDRLKQAIIKQMSLVNSPMFNPSISFSRVFFEENPDFLQILNENARFSAIRYNNIDYQYYVSNFTYTMSQGEILPDVSVDLVTELNASSNSLQVKLDAVKQDVLNTVGSTDALMQVTPYFLRKDSEDTAEKQINFAKGITIGKYSEGNFGSGAAILVDENGNVHSEVDYLNVRKKASFSELVIEEEKAIGGDLLISPAGIVISRVEPSTNYYRCYFKKTDTEGSTVYNPFKIGDLARCQTFNYVTNKYYWRKVVAVGDDYVDLSSATGEFDGTGIPASGDNLVQLGNVSDTERQSAIWLSSYGGNAPSLKMYQGINSFSLTDKDMFGVEYDYTNGYPRFYNYGSMRLGARESEQGGYITYDHVNKQLNINAVVNFLPQSTGLEQMDAYQRLVQIAQGNIETWFYDGATPSQTGAPTMSNYPVRTWQSQDYESHVGDIYYSDSGKGYRFKKSGTTYSWEIISDSELAQAMSQIQALQYLKTATNEGTLISGGLVLTSMIQLGYTHSGQYHVMSGINGLGQDDRGIAAWFGGPMADKEVTPSPSEYAASLFRFDGTGYLAQGNITWDANGYGQVGGSGNSFAVKWDADGVHLGNGLLIGSTDRTLESIINVLNRVDGYFTIVERTEDGVTKKYLKVSNQFAGFYADGEISAGGLNAGGGGSNVYWDGVVSQGKRTLVVDGVSQSLVVDVISALGYTPVNQTALSNYQTKLSSSNRLAWEYISNPSTIAGYGITNAYTKTETDTAISTAISTAVASYLPLAGGTMSGEIKFGDDVTWLRQVNGNNSVLGYVVSSTGFSGVTSGLYLGAAGCNLTLRATSDISIYRNSHSYTNIDTGNIGSQSVNYATSAGSVAWTNVSGRPTKLSQLTDDVVSGHYLPLTGGSLSGALTVSGPISSTRNQVYRGTQFLSGSSYNSRSLSTVGWYRIATTSSTAAGANVMRIWIKRTYNNSYTEAYIIDLSIGYSTSSTSFGDGIQITQVSGDYGTQRIPKIRVAYNRSNTSGVVSYVDLYYNHTSANTVSVWVDGYATFNQLVAVTDAPTNVYEFNLTRGLHATQNILADGEVTAGSLSDRRFKDNVRDFEDAMGIIRQLRPVTFDWNGLATSYCAWHKGSDFGLIAQEVAPVLPSVISPIYQHYMRVDYSKLSALCIAGLQEHDSEIETLKLRVEELENKLSRYES